jgi:hypothetical protein
MICLFDILYFETLYRCRVLLITCPCMAAPHASGLVSFETSRQGCMDMISRLEQAARKMIPSWSIECHDSRVGDIDLGRR